MELSVITKSVSALRQAMNLVRTEVQLARTEFSEILSRIESAARLLAAAAIILIPSIVVLLYAGAAALVEEAGLSWTIATLIVGGAVVGLCLALLAFGASRLRTRNLAPTKTMRQLRRDADLVRDIAGDQYEEENKRAA